jgi:hypothetical protein
MLWQKCYNASSKDCNKALQQKPRPLVGLLRKVGKIGTWQTQASEALRERARTQSL